MPTPDARRSRKRLQLTVAVLGVVAAVALVGSGAALREARDVGKTSRIRLCQEENKTRSVLRSILNDARNAIEHLPPSPQREAALSFYDQQIAKIDGLDCGEITKSKEGR